LLIISLLNYYAFIFIASELDTYDYLSGTGFYSQAIELASLGKNSDWSIGWDERWKKARKIKSNEYLRSMRFNFFSAMDALSIEKINVNLIKSSMNSFYEDLDKLDKKIGNDKETLHFLKAYHNQIAELCSALKMKDALQLLILYDSDHKDVYALYLNK